MTCRAAWEGGEYRGDEPTRAALYESLLNADVRPRYIDVERSAFQRDPHDVPDVEKGGELVDVDA